MQCLIYVIFTWPRGQNHRCLKWVLGPEWRDVIGKSLIIARALYSLKSDGVSYITHLATCMQKLGFQSIIPTLTYGQNLRPGDKFMHNFNSLCNANDIPCIQYDLDDKVNKFNWSAPLKPATIRSSDIYLGTKLKTMQLHNGIFTWSMSPFN